MDMHIDSKKLLENIEKTEPERKTFSVYVDKKLMGEFQAAVGKRVSRVLEDLIRAFMDDLGTKKKKG